MPASTIEATARKRLRRTRTRAVSDLPPLAISTLKPHQVDLHPDCVSLRCPTCKTWCPIYKAETRTPKLAPHHTEPAGTEDPNRCQGSNRIVILDRSLAQWAKDLEDGVAATSGRRSNRVVRKPQSRVTPAITQIVTPILNARGALKLYQDHCRRCTTCQKPGRTRCTDGVRLAHLYTHKQRTEPARAALAVQEELRRQEEEDRDERGLPLLRELKWASTASSVRRTDVQRVHDQLTAVKLQYGAHLDPFEQADIDSAIRMLARQLRCLS